MRTLISNIRRFGSDKSGAVTVDWVALTAAVVVIGIGLVYTIFGTGDDGLSGIVTGLTTEMTQAGDNLEDGVAAALPTPGVTATP